MGGDRSTEIRLLGPLEVRVGGRVVPIPRPKQRSLVAILALAPGVCVPKERLIDELWGVTPPETASHGLQVHVSALRKLLGAELIETCPGGYRLAVPADAVDASRAEALIAQGRAEGDREKLGEAVALFRGQPLAGTELEGRDAARLEDLRHEALEEQFDLELAAGAGAALVAPLERLVAESPLRERPRGQLMRALYRAGRQADALAAFQDARRTFVEELGIEPSPALREIEKAILQQDESLAAPAATRAAEPVIRRRRRLALALAFAALATTAGVAAAFFLPPGKPSAASAGATTTSPSTLIAAPVGKASAHKKVRRVVRPVVVSHGVRTKRIVAMEPAATVPAIVVVPATTVITTSAALPVTTAPPTARVTTQPKIATHPTRTTPAPAPMVTTSADPVHIVDTFDSGAVDTSTWNVFVNGIGADAVQRDGKLVISIAPGAKPGGPYNFVGAQYGTRSCFSGDIDMQLDYRLVSWPASSGAYVGLQAVFADAMVDRLADANSPADSIGSMIKPRWTSVTTTGNSGSLRLRRVDGIATTYYLDNGAWQQIDTGPAPNPAHLHIGVSMNPGLSPSSNIAVELDNFSATASGPTNC